jgi:hypothetical protein
LICLYVQNFDSFVRSYSANSVSAQIGLKTNSHTIVVIINQEKKYNETKLSVEMIVHQYILNA